MTFLSHKRMGFAAWKAMLSGVVPAVGIAVLSPVAAADGPLSGPGVKTDGSSATLVERNIDGSMRRLEIPPAEAALEQMTLTEGVRADIGAMLAERAALMDGIVSKNLEKIRALRDGGEGGKPDRREQFRALREMFAPVLEEGPLEDRIADLLPEAQRDEFWGMIDEHRRAQARERAQHRIAERGLEAEFLGEPIDEPMLFDDEMAPGEGLAPGDGPPEFREGRGGPLGDKDGEGRRMMMQMGSLRHEIRRSVERVVGERQNHMQRLIEGLGLTGEQETRVRALFRSRRASGDGSKPDRAERREMMRAIAEILTPEQRAKMRELSGGNGRGEGPPRGERPGRRPIDD